MTIVLPPDSEIIITGFCTNLCSAEPEAVFQRANKTSNKLRMWITTVDSLQYMSLCLVANNNNHKLLFQEAAWADGEGSQFSCNCLTPTLITNLTCLWLFPNSTPPHFLNSELDAFSQWGSLIN